MAPHQSSVIRQSASNILTENLKAHLDAMADSVSYYFGALVTREVPQDLAEDLVVDWHKGKVQVWVDEQKIKAERQPNGTSPRR